MKELFKRRQSLKNKFINREKIFACWTSLSHPSITEMFCKAPFDFVGIDIEHSTISQEQSQRIIAAAQSSGSLCLPRIASHNMEMSKRLLDSGADGLIVPMVSTPEEVEEIISWVKYAPLGNRSFGISRGQGYGFDFDQYTSEWNDVSLVIVQIESIEGVNNIEKIISMDELDSVMIGPYDLSGSLGVPGEIDHPKVKDACKHVIDACLKRKKSCGTQVVEPSLKTVNTAFSEGYNFVVLASDIFVLWKWSDSMKNIMQKIGDE